MIDFHEKFLKILNELSFIDIFKSNNSENLPEDSFYILNNLNSKEQYYINSKKFNSLFSELFKVDLIDFNNLVSFYNMNLSINNKSIRNKNIMVTFQKKNNKFINIVGFYFFGLDFELRINLEDETSIKEGFNKIKNDIYDNFKTVISRFGFKPNTITAKDINYIHNFSISNYIRKINKINNLNYIDFQEAIDKVKNVDFNFKDRDIIFTKENVKYLYDILLEILPLEQKKLKQIIEIYNFYCSFTNQEMRITFNFKKFTKDLKFGPLYYIHLENFLFISIGNNFFKEKEKILFSFDTIEGDSINTNSSEILYMEILNIFSEEFSKVLKKEVNQIKYKDLYIIKMLTI